MRQIKFSDTTCVISSPNHMFDHLLDSSHLDDSNKWSNIGFGEEIGIIEFKIRTSSGALYMLFKWSCFIMSMKDFAVYK